MINKHFPYEKPVFAAGLILMSFLIGFALVPYHQACEFKEQFTGKAQVAVFIAADSKAAPEVLSDKLDNIDGVVKVEYVPKERILEKVQAENSKLKNIVLTGENPFLPYYLVTPGKKDPESVSKLRIKIAAIEGVEETVCDEDLLLYLEKAEMFLKSYGNTAKFALLMLLALILVKYVFRLIRKKVRYVQYIYNALTGIMAGSIGAVLYYLFSNRILKADVLYLPAKYGICFVVGAVLSALLWEND